MVRARCTYVLTLGAIACLLMVIVIVWVQFSQGAFDKPLRAKISNRTMIVGATTKINHRMYQPMPHSEIQETTKRKEFIEKSHLDDLGVEEAIYVKPLKINPDDENISFVLNKHGKSNISTDEPIVRHHSGHFRHKTAEIWDPYPKYEIDAFGKKLILELEINHNFVAPDLDIVQHGYHRAESTRHDTKISKCFYTGKLRNDQNSVVSVNLCHGMTGYIRSSEANYYIEPAENFTTGSLGTILHRIKKLPHTIQETNEIPIVEPFDVVFRNDNGSHSIVEDDFPEEIVEAPHNIQKRDLTLDEDIIYDSFKNDYNSLPEVLRTTRNTNSKDIFTKESNEYFIKVLIVADSTMLEYHKTHEAVTKYILILMSHVALLFKEPSIGNAISVTVAHIRILDYPIDIISNSLSQDMLIGFCRWKQKHISSESHDIALLLTRRAICKNTTSCATLGVAEVDSMCRPSGCTIVRDKGLSTSYTIAHELGHAMSMPHDDDKKCAVHNKGTTTNNIMTGTTKNDSKPFMWSACSKHYATEFLDSSRSNCLLRQPSRNELSPDYSRLLPGDIFEIDKQCELEFAPGFKFCNVLYNDACNHLWCRDLKGSCFSQFSPWAEGTKCGAYRWCYKRKCIDQDRSEIVPTDGGWGEWQDWSECSRTCGGGISKSIRLCDSPRPEHGGKYCTGKTIRYKSCNTQDCDGNAQDFRDKQCSSFNGITKSLPNLTNDVEWVAKFGLGSPERPDDYCRLYCKPKHSSAYYALKDKVIDGTKCGKSGFDICVNGICKPGGCDNMLDSRSVLDDCGVCKGDNSTCREMKGIYNKTADSVSYNEVVRIPKGSSNIEIVQISHGTNDNFLALRDGETGHYILNGGQMLMTQEIDVQFGPTIIRYSGSSAIRERITTMRNQKLYRVLIVEVLSIARLSPPDITFRYVTSEDMAPRYGWRLPGDTNWTRCSSICDGIQKREPKCFDLDSDQESHFCDQNELDSATEKRQCNTHCSLTWMATSKGTCSSRCGKGYRKIYYNCIKTSKDTRDQVNNEHCSRKLPQPESTEVCYSNCNTTHWEYTDWSECSKPCGGGTQMRTAFCVDENNIKIHKSHCHDKEKILEQRCNTAKCPTWKITDESECSVECGGGYKNVTYECVLGGKIQNPNACNPEARPPSKKRCNEYSCWRLVAEGYYPCSVTCGKGIERRRYVCKKFNSEEELDQKYCRGIIPPRDSRNCSRECNEISVYDRSKIYQWMPGNWTACSQSCNGGMSMQQYHCINELGQENPSMCNINIRPQNYIRCNEQPCPKWTLSEWSPKCDSNCERHRQVLCLDDMMTKYDDRYCNQKKPPSSTKCKLIECPHLSNSITGRYFGSKNDKENRYKWKAGPWKQCSTNCGKGTRRRAIECEDTLNEISVVDSLCDNKQKPKASKACEKYHCNHVWLEGHWSPCSASCGLGIKTRNVTCHKVHQGGIVDPNPLPNIERRIIHKNYCKLDNKPNTSEKCEVSRCGDQYIWHAEEWKKCSHACGKRGRQVRVLYCISVHTKQKVPKHFCPKKLKPPRKRKCNQFKCLYGSCKEIKQRTGTKENKDYVISLRGQTVKIYCYRMDTPEPQEFISLDPDKENYAELYAKRLMDLNTCPYNGVRRDNCRCDQISQDRHGFTKFWKVRLNITLMQIIDDDFTFSLTLKGSKIPYGTAGDCYSKVRGCSQGRFSIDLSHTSFKLNRQVRWLETGQFASMSIRKMNTLVQGKCGGYCGKCYPDPAYGLLVDTT
ncbi:hypothetical protein GWI33_016056 [Rhynchophorus ferrugineus]|uniref:A disintegrin and metalloproteinase with thrombospondin motifs 9 n=1 Tax=Rhynchophorus ferrugineus TaxID=354439 RepID=A0A834I2G6_RHYFE|nr:hypothetical protein GWI33_016056 [Rhynchophorus ferrugineus]